MIYRQKKIRWAVLPCALFFGQVPEHHHGLSASAEKSPNSNQEGVSLGGKGALNK